MLRVFNGEREDHVAKAACAVRVLEREDLACGPYPSVEFACRVSRDGISRNVDRRRRLVVSENFAAEIDEAQRDADDDEDRAREREYALARKAENRLRPYVAESNSR